MSFPPIGSNFPNDRKTRVSMILMTFFLFTLCWEIFSRILKNEEMTPCDH